MKSSPYITWAKERAALRYSLARSGVSLCSLEELGAGPEDLDLHSHDEDGWIPLREAVAARYGVPVEGVALAHGTSLANHLAITLLLDHGDVCLVEHPGYEPLMTLPRMLGAQVGTFDRLAGDLVETVRRALTPQVRLLILSDPHNPTGLRLDAGDIERLADLAEERDFHLLLDEIYLDLAAATPRSAAAKSPRLLATGGLTKSFGLGALRIGWVLAEPAIAERIRRLNDLFTLVLAHPSERLGLRALQNADRILAPRRTLLATNRPLVDAFIRERPELSWTMPEVGTVGWVRLEGPSAEDLARVLEASYDSAIVPGRFFGEPSCFRIGYGMPTEDLHEALARLGASLDSLQAIAPPGGIQGNNPQ